MSLFQANQNEQPQTLLEKVETLQNLLVARATGDGNGDGYFELRAELQEHPQVRTLLPRFVRTCRDASQFWNFIKHKFATYQERRTYLWDEFRPLLEHLESGLTTPSDGGASEILATFDKEHVHAVWDKALDRRAHDPEGAITLARTLLETVCKHILDDAGETYGRGASLPSLYSQTARTLTLAPSQHTEQVFRQILGGCQAVVEGLGAVRNRLSDAHGKGRQPIKPSPRHAELAVNLAGAMATFLVTTHEKRGGPAGT